MPGPRASIAGRVVPPVSPSACGICGAGGVEAWALTWRFGVRAAHLLAFVIEDTVLMSGLIIAQLFAERCF